MKAERTKRPNNKNVIPNWEPIEPMCKLNLRNPERNPNDADPAKGNARMKSAARTIFNFQFWQPGPPARGVSALGWKYRRFWQLLRPSAYPWVTSSKPRLIWVEFLFIKCY